jgi:hypothetical protein
MNLDIPRPGSADVEKHSGRKRVSFVDRDALVNAVEVIALRDVAIAEIGFLN